MGGPLLQAAGPILGRSTGAAGRAWNHAQPAYDPRHMSKQKRAIELRNLALSVVKARGP